jgi:hypothetical protein
MADTTTNLKIKADDREIKKLRQSVKTAFDSRTLREFRTETRDLERQVVSLSRRQSDLTKQLEGIDKGTKKFKALKEQIKEVADHTKLVTTAMQQLDRVQQRAIRQTGVSGGRRFLQGAAQGAGIAQYIPSAPGMGAQIGGAALAGGVRRAAGMAAAPFTMPGIGGVAAGLQGIPLVGGMAAGALQQAAASYQSAVQFDRARMQNLSYMGAAHSTRERAVAKEWARTQARRSFAKDVGGAQAESAAAMIAAGQEMPESRAFGMGVGHQFQLTGLGTAGNAATSTEARQRLQKTGAAEKTARDKQKAREDALFGAATMRMPMESFGVSMGMGAMQTQAAFGSFMQARGGRFGEVGDRRGRGQFREALAAQVQFGVGTAQSGQFGRMGMAGGGGTGMMGLATVLQSAVAVGLKGSQVPEFLQTLVGLGQSAEKQGIKLNVAEFSKMTMQLKSGGLEGLQGQRIAGGFVQATQGLAQRGVQSPLDVLMLRGAGFDPSQGLEGYAAAMQRLETPDADLMSNVMGMITQGTGGFGSGGRRLLAKRALGRMGIQVGLKQAGTLTEAFGRGEAPDIAGLLAARGAQGGAGGMIAAAQGMAPASAKKAAMLEAQRIGVGRKADWVVEFEKNAIATGGVMNNFSNNLKDLSGLVAGLVKGLDSLTKGGMGGIVGKVLGAYGKSVGVNFLLPPGEQ